MIKKFLVIFLFIIAGFNSFSQPPISEYRSTKCLLFKANSDKTPSSIKTEHLIQFVRNIDSSLLYIKNISGKNFSTKIWATDLVQALEDVVNKHVVYIFHGLELIREVPILLGLRYDERNRLVRVGIMGKDTTIAFIIEHKIDFL